MNCFSLRIMVRPFFSEVMLDGTKHCTFRVFNRKEMDPNISDAVSQMLTIKSSIWKSDSIITSAVTENE